MQSRKGIDLQQLKQFKHSLPIRYLFGCHSGDLYINNRSLQ